MKLLSVDTAQSWWYGSVKDFNPRGIAWFSVITPWLANTYKLQFVPNDPSKPKEDVVKFENGEFFYKNSDLPISVSLSIYPGGLGVSTGFSTDASDAFLEDLFAKFSETFKLPPYKEVIRQKRYFSQLWVSTSKSLNVLNPQLQQINAYLSENVLPEGNIFEVGGISFWPDQTTKFPPSPFTLERAAASLFSEERYFSRAPLQTDKHLELLSKLESILG